LTPASPQNLRVLAISGQDTPVAWTTNYGKGRVFVSQIGHDDAVWDRKDVQGMYFEAIPWVMHLPPPALSSKSR
jgi:type 1 glutamine amidotransferase